MLPGKPTITSVASVSDGSTNVTVAAPTEPGSPPLSNFTLTIVPANGTGGNITVFWTGSVDGNGVPSFIIPYGVLSPYVDYTFYATAVSTAGSGPQSDPYDYVDPDTCLVQNDVCVLEGRRRLLLFATPPCCTGTLCVDANQGMVCAGRLKSVAAVAGGDGIEIDGPLLNISFTNNYAGATEAGMRLLCPMNLGANAFPSGVPPIQLSPDSPPLPHSTCHHVQLSSTTHLLLSLPTPLWPISPSADWGPSLTPAAC